MTSSDGKTPMPATTDHLTANVFDTPKTLTPAASHETMKSGGTDHDDAHLTVPTRALFSYNRTNQSPHDLEKGPQENLTRLHTATSSAAGSVAPSSCLYTPSRGYSVDGCRAKECSMWPSRQTLKEKAKQEKSFRRKGNCFGLSARWGSLSKKQRLWTKILIALLVVAFAIGVGIGISKAVGGGVWAGDSRQEPIAGVGS